LSLATDKIVTNPAPTIPSAVGRQLTPKQNSNTPQPLTHQIPPSGQAADEEQPGAACRPFKIETPLTLPAGTVNRPFSVAIQVSGGFPPVSFALMKGAVLPPGLELNSRGRISGTPIASGFHRFGILAYDRCPSGVQAEEKYFTLAIHGTVPTTLQNRNETLYRQVPVSGKGAFHLTGIDLFFENRGASIVVEKNAVLPRLIAQVRLEGEGIVRGYWQVDNGQAKPFTQRVRGPVAAFSFPEQAALPTSELGRHDVRLVIANTGKEMPDILASYRVLGGDTRAEGDINRQIMVTVLPKNGPRIEGLLRKVYALRQVEYFDIKSLGLRTYVFESDGDIPAQLKVIRKESDVLQAGRNQVFKTLGDPKSSLQQIAGSLNFASLHAQNRGRGVRVAVIDTGVDGDHRDLKDRVILNENMLANSPFRAEIHGTAVAGIIGASINGFGIEGVAPEVALLAMRACRQVSENDPGGRGDTVATVKALDAALMQRVKIVNMSFGAPRPDGLIEMLLAKGTAAGVLFVAPVGNDRGMRSALFPASNRMVIAVGGQNAKGDPYPDAHALKLARVCAPADNIFTTIPDERFNFLTGTSMSSAIVTGILALAVEQRPDLTLEDIPSFGGSTCQWMEHMMGIRVCAP
jgi:Subtilase family